MTEDTGSLKIDTLRIKRNCTDDLSIPIGAEIVIHSAERGSRFKTTFIGLINKEHVLLRLTNKIRQAGISPNEKLTVRYISGSLVYGFGSTVTAIITKPSPILFIEHPEFHETLNLRKDDRVHCFLPITIFIDSNEGKGKLVNISNSGCRIIIEKEAKGNAFADITAGTEIFCKIQLPDNNEQLYAKGIVRAVEPHDNKIRLGLQFMTLEDNVHDAIDHYVAASLEYMEGE